MASFFKSKNKEYKFQDETILKDIKDNIVLVLGGAGIVGSSLCRQILKYEPKQLLVLDINESSLYELKQELKDIKVILGSTSDMDKINEVFKEYTPDFVFHVATYKNIDILEDSPCEAIKNNVLGTYNVARASRQYGTKHFYFISNNEAEEPQNTMSKSMAICEIVVEGSNRYADNTKYQILRFDNQLITNYNFDKNLNYDDLTFKIQTLVIAARTNDSNKTEDYIRQALK